MDDIILYNTWAAPWERMITMKHLLLPPHLQGVQVRGFCFTRDLVSHGTMYFITHSLWSHSKDSSLILMSLSVWSTYDWTFLLMIEGFAWTCSDQRRYGHKASVGEKIHKYAPFKHVLHEFAFLKTVFCIDLSYMKRSGSARISGICIWKYSTYHWNPTLNFLPATPYHLCIWRSCSDLGLEETVVVYVLCH